MAKPQHFCPVAVRGRHVFDRRTRRARFNRRMGPASFQTPHGTGTLSNACSSWLRPGSRTLPPCHSSIPGAPLLPLSPPSHLLKSSTSRARFSSSLLTPSFPLHYVPTCPRAAPEEPSPAAPFPSSLRLLSPHQLKITTSSAFFSSSSPPSTPPAPPPASCVRTLRQARAPACPTQRPEARSLRPRATRHAPALRPRTRPGRAPSAAPPGAPAAQGTAGHRRFQTVPPSAPQMRQAQRRSRGRAGAAGAPAGCRASCAAPAAACAATAGRRPPPTCAAAASGYYMQQRSLHLAKLGHNTTLYIYQWLDAFARTPATPLQSFQCCQARPAYVRHTPACDFAAGMPFLQTAARSAQSAGSSAHNLPPATFPLEQPR
eukprot:356312-Chlamydomonas_euryale.AAC.2